MSTQNRYGMMNETVVKPFQMIDNYIYLYHTDTLIALPLYPESIDDTMTVTYREEIPLSSTAPIFSYSNSGPRTLSITLPLHRDMMTSINVEKSNLNIDLLSDDDYVDIMVRQLQSIAVPNFMPQQTAVNPPQVAIRFGGSIFCKGVVNGSVSVSHSGPIINYNGVDKYAMVTVSFTVYETDPYDAESIAKYGGFRGLNTTLERKIWRPSN